MNKELRQYITDLGIDITSSAKEKNSTTKVLVGMSGGVDSAVTALLLKEQGYDVTAGFMRNWVEEDDKGVCTSQKDYQDVRVVSKQLDIPYYSFDFSKEYFEKVFKQFIEDYKNGLTPNPDVFCNKEIKFDCFFELKNKLGFDKIATGHYCSINFDGDVAKLAKGLDPKKDQSYFLSCISGHVLKDVMFPLGNIEKTQVRQLAQLAGLANRAKKDSTGVCFIGERDFKKFLKEYIDSTKGTFQTLSGEVVGEHEGSCFYTIGQRKGLGLGGPGEPWYVVNKNHDHNIVYVERQHDHPELFSSTVKLDQVHWIVDQPIKNKLKAKVRYRQADQDCEISSLDGSEATVYFPKAQRAICPKQIVVFYDGNICLGSGMIKDAWK